MSLRETFGRTCRDTRIRLDLTQAQVGEAAGVSRGHLANVEAGRANATLAQVERIGRALGLDLALVATAPVFLSERRPHDLVHARCSGYVSRRLVAAGWLVAREVQLGDGRIRGWIDILAFDPLGRTLLVIEIKTRLDDLGAVERQLGAYTRNARNAAAERRWRPASMGVWLLALASDEVDAAVTAQRDVMDLAFPGRADHMAAVIRNEAAPLERAVALVDPASRRASWMIRTRIDGRRSPAPYDGYADAARRFAPSR